MKNQLITITSFVVLAACSPGHKPFDASGTFEAVETLVPAEASGTLKAFTVEEGQVLQEGQAIGYVDSLQLYLKKKQLHAQIRAVLSKKPNISAQLSSLYTLLNHARKEQQRIANLLKSDAATQKQYDDATAQVLVLERQIEGQESTLAITTASLSEEALPLQAQIEQLNDQLAKCKIVNPMNGTVLIKYAETYEAAVTGKPLYKIADLSIITLRAYITGDQLTTIKLNQKVTVLVDYVAGEYKEYQGTIEWISDKAEFTPKTIQTKDERANLVYAIKVKVANDGLLKIGMYADVKL